MQSDWTTSPPKPATPPSAAAAARNAAAAANQLRSLHAAIISGDTEALQWYKMSASPPRSGSPADVAAATPVCAQQPITAQRTTPTSASVTTPPQTTTPFTHQELGVAQAVPHDVATYPAMSTRAGVLYAAAMCLVCTTYKALPQLSVVQEALLLLLLTSAAWVALVALAVLLAPKIAPASAAAPEAPFTAAQKAATPSTTKALRSRFASTATTAVSSVSSPLATTRTPPADSSKQAVSTVTHAPPAHEDLSTSSGGSFKKVVDGLSNAMDHLASSFKSSTSPSSSFKRGPAASGGVTSVLSYALASDARGVSFSRAGEALHNKSKPSALSIAVPPDATEVEEDSFNRSRKMSKLIQRGGGGEGSFRKKKRNAISASVVGDRSDSPEASSPLRKKRSDEEADFVAAVLSKSSLFSGWTPEQRRRLAAAAELRQVDPGETIIVEGDAGDTFFVVYSGVFKVFVKAVDDSRTPVFTYETGTSFGELALLYNRPRSASIRCTAAGVVFVLDRATFRRVLKASAEQSLIVSSRLLRTCLESTPALLERLSEEQLSALTSILVEEHHEDGAIVCERGAPMDSLLLVKEGLLFADRGDGAKGPLQSYHPGDFFGAEALADLGEATSRAVLWPCAISAAGPATLLRLRREVAAALVGDLQALDDDDFAQHMVGSLGEDGGALCGLSRWELSILVDALAQSAAEHARTFAAGAPIVHAGDESACLHIIRRGRVCVPRINGAGVRTLAVGDSFGGEGLLAKSTHKATVRAVEPTVVWMLDDDTIERALGHPCAELLGRAAGASSWAAASPRTRASSVALSDLAEVGTLGTGTFGLVTLVSHAKTARTYALKQMSKRHLLDNKSEQHVLHEKRLLQRCRHPLIVELIATYQDERHVYMLLEVALGGELWTLLQQAGSFEEDAARFYASCVAAALMHLHDLNVAYRDLKPENLLLDRHGYVKLCDFGFAKQVTDRTYTVCGTPEYLAPEIITNAGHGLAVDWWALGILVFEMVSGDPPFQAEAASPDMASICALILKGEFEYPEGFSPQLVDLIGGLLEKQPSLRLGIARRGHRELAAHPFFGGINLHTLAKRTGEPPPPYVPNVDDETDLSNFLSDQCGTPGADASAQPLTFQEQQRFAEF